MSGDRGGHGIGSFLRIRRLRNVLPTIRHCTTIGAEKALLNKVGMIQSLNSHARTVERFYQDIRCSNETRTEHPLITSQTQHWSSNLLLGMSNWKLFLQGTLTRQLRVGLIVIHSLPSVLLAIRFVNSDGVSGYQTRRTGPTRCIKLLSLPLRFHFDRCFESKLTYFIFLLHKSSAHDLPSAIEKWSTAQEILSCMEAEGSLPCLVRSISSQSVFQRFILMPPSTTWSHRFFLL
jgi:hypothetical protein